MRPDSRLFPLLVIFVLLLSIPAFAHQIPTAIGYINDFAGVLTSTEKHQLETISEEVRAANGTELVVVTVKRVGGDFDRARIEYFNEQGIGQEWANNGVLILLATIDRRIGITTGKGMEGALPDSLCKEIIDTKGIPHWQKGSERWGEGLVAIALELVPYIKGEKFPRKGFAGCGSWLTPLIIAYLIFMAVIIIVGYAKRVRCPVCRGKVKLLKKTVVLEPSTETPGLEKREFECEVCKYKFIRSVTLPALGKRDTSGGFWGGWSSSSSGGWSSSSGGSFGGFSGGCSGGGGASSSF
jgi:uncharacterized protein